MTTSLAGKIALVTGASRGIGAAIADTLAQAGATVIGTATSESGASAIAQRLAPWNGTGRTLNAATPDSVEALIADVEKEFGKLDILVNNAGITRDNLLMRMKEEEWDEIMNVNLKSVYRASKAVLRGMMKQRAGRIITITSVVGTMGNAGQTNYAAAKGALHAAVKTLALECASRGVTVNAVAPGIIASDMSARAFDEDAIRRLVPMQRAGQPQEVADLVAFLASDRAAYISGQTIGINGALYQ